VLLPVTSVSVVYVSAAAVGVVLAA